MGNTPKIFRFYIMFIHFPMMFQIKIAISSIFDQYPPLHQNKPWKIAKKLRYHEVPSVESTPPTPNPWQGQRAVEVNNLEPEIQHTSPGHGLKGKSEGNHLGFHGLTSIKYTDGVRTGYGSHAEYQERTQKIVHVSDTVHTSHRWGVNHVGSYPSSSVISLDYTNLNPPMVLKNAGTGYPLLSPTSGTGHRHLCV